MSLRDMFQRLIVQLFVERSEREKTLDDIAASLQESSHEISLCLSGLDSNLENCERLAHMIAIERWGQARIRVALGETFLPDEADAYLPSPESSWQELVTAFIAARQATLALIQEVQAVRLPDDFKIHHNQFGPLSVKGWLRYLDEHAVAESTRLEAAG